MINLAQALDFAVQLAKDCGAEARKRYNPDLAYDPKDDNSPVTQADVVINRLVIERCRAAYPESEVLGEEERTADTAEWLWVCDPIDGTIPYMLGMHASTFCLALVHQGKPVLGVVYDFMDDRLYSALQGKGVWLNGKPLRLSTTSLPLKMVNLEFFPLAPNQVGDVRERLLAEKYHVLNLASNAYIATNIATGRIAGSIYAGDKPWDVAAAKVIVEECGGAVTDLDGNEQRYDRPIKGAVLTHTAYGAEIRRTLDEARRAVVQN